MTQITKGIKLGYGVYTPAVGETPAVRPSSYTYIPNITGIPSLGSAPTTHQVTDLDNTAHVYIKGLMDIGGNLEFPCNFSDVLMDAVDIAILAEEGGAVHEWAVEFPAPLSRRAYFNGEVSVFNDSGDVDSPLVGTVAITPNTEIEWEDITG